MKQTAKNIDLKNKKDKAATNPGIKSSNMLNKPVLRAPVRGDEKNATEAEIRDMWQRYKDNPNNKQLREFLILQYLHLVRYVVNRLPVNLPVSIGQEDLLSFGTLGLIEAFERFDLARGLKFETYAVSRIRGSIIDQLRYFDWVPRGVRKRAKDLQEATHRLEQKLGRSPNEAELSVELNITPERLKTIISESNNLLISLDEGRGDDNNTNSLSLLDLLEDKNTPDPLSVYETVDLKERLAQAIEKLPEREKLLVALYYHENLTLREIGDIINVSESRVCQLHAQAINRLRNFLSSYQ